MTAPSRPTRRYDEVTEREIAEANDAAAVARTAGCTCGQEAGCTGAPDIDDEGMAVAGSCPVCLPLDPYDPCPVTAFGCTGCGITLCLAAERRGDL